MANAQRQAYYQQNKEDIKAKTKAYYKIHLLTAKNNLYILLGGFICKRCGYNDMRALQIDHIENDGFKQKNWHSCLTFYTYWNKRPDEAKLKLQVLCANCNWIKRGERK